MCIDRLLFVCNQLYVFYYRISSSRFSQVYPKSHPHPTILRETTRPPTVKMGLPFLLHPISADCRQARTRALSFLPSFFPTFLLFFFSPFLFSFIFFFITLLLLFSSLSSLSFSSLIFLQSLLFQYVGEHYMTLCRSQESAEHFKNTSKTTLCLEMNHRSALPNPDYAKYYRGKVSCALPQIHPTYL